MKFLKSLTLKALPMILVIFSFSSSTSFAYPTYGIAYGYVPGYSSSTGSYTMTITDIPFQDLSHVAFFVALVNGTSVALSNGASAPSLISHAHLATPNPVRCYLT